MSTRSTEIAWGKDFALSIKKTDLTILGCASNVEYSGQLEVLTANCQSGKKQIPSGDDPTYTLTVTGFYHIYDSANVAANVSATEIEGFMQAKTEIDWKFAPPHVGDPTRAGKGYITAFSIGAPVEGLATYNFTITPFAMPTLGTVSA